MNKESPPWVWVFHGEGARFSSGVFSSVEDAEEWIGKFRLSGLLTQYPVGTGVYQWAVQHGYFVAKKEGHGSPKMVQRFSSAYTPHFHYENGERVS